MVTFWRRLFVSAIGIYIHVNTLGTKFKTCNLEGGELFNEAATQVGPGPLNWFEPGEMIADTVIKSHSRQRVVGACDVNCARCLLATNVLICALDIDRS